VEGHLRHPLHSLQISENVVIISVPFLNRSSNPVAGRSIAFSVAFLSQAACNLQLTSHFVVVVCKLPLNLTFLYTFLPRWFLAMRILSVRLSVTRVDCGKTVERSVQIYIPYERTFSLVF